MSKSKKHGLKVNGKKGLARGGSKVMTQHITLAKVANDANQRTTKTIIVKRPTVYRGRTLAEMVYESYGEYLKRMNTPVQDASEQADAK